MVSTMVCAPCTGFRSRPRVLCAFMFSLGLCLYLFSPCLCLRSHSGAQCITCSYKATSGLLYPLERGFIYVHKPPVHLRFEEISCVNFARGTTTTRSFDFEIETKQGNQYTFSSIERYTTQNSLHSDGAVWCPRAIILETRLCRFSVL